MFEAIHILHKRNGAPRSACRAYFAKILQLPFLEMDHALAIENALDFWVEQPSLDFADCYHLALAKDLGMTQVYSFDKKIHRYPGIARIEPA